MPGDILLNQDFSEFVKLLDIHEVRYLIIGGYAVAFHGHPRYTKDIDIWVARDPVNANRIIKALEAFGFGAVGLSADDFLKVNQTVQLGYPPSRIDILTTVKGLDFEECYPTREEVELQGLRVNFIDLPSLRKNKRAVGRHQDLADLENLE